MKKAPQGCKEQWLLKLQKKSCFWGNLLRARCKSWRRDHWFQQQVFQVVLTSVTALSTEGGKAARYWRSSHFIPSSSLAHSKHQDTLQPSILLPSPKLLPPAAFPAPHHLLPRGILLPGVQILPHPKGAVGMRGTRVPLCRYLPLPLSPVRSCKRARIPRSPEQQQQARGKIVA